MKLLGKDKEFLIKTLKIFLKKNEYEISDRLFDDFIDLMICCSAGEFKFQTIEKYFLHCIVKYQPEATDICNLYRKIYNIGSRVTFEKLTLMYGPVEGKIRWDNYCNKQSETNTFEYKSEKYGMTREQFDAYNKNRAATLENMIKRHGEEDGIQKFNVYSKRQSYAGCSLEYFKEKYGEGEGEEFYNNLNKKKAQTLENMITRYGSEEGTLRYDSWRELITSKMRPNYSGISQVLFNTLSESITDFDTYYGSKNKEITLYSKKYRRGFAFDFAIPQLKLFVEFNGDFYHANPRFYKEDFVFEKYPWYGKSVKDVWQRDIDKRDFAKSLGYDVYTIWEYDYKNDNENCIKQCLEYINELRKRKMQSKISRNSDS